MGEKRSTSEYFAEYWKENRDSVNERRRKLYANDPEYAKKQREASQAYKKRKRQEELDRRARDGEPLVKSGGGPRRPVIVNVAGEDVEAYSVQKLCDHIGRPKSDISNWRRLKILPDSPFRNKRGDRLYTMDMINAIKRAIDCREKISINDPGFGDDIISDWRDSGVDV